ncbi:Aspartate carbamoyltransferase catalytic subunit [invertebrate metagenome]|uniref:aspartate carbamoyltransferase n=1 Tax=invertebrate metagenome TaxID=1711999 RepID=A0A2H9TC49_9ZZZZ
MSNRLFHRDIISIADLTREDIELILETASILKRHPRTDLLKGQVIASCFFEASTRTRLSFETAVERLGGTLIGFADGGNTSLAKKGETLADSIRIIGSYTDAIVMRHPQEGAARLASEFSSVPVINGGDGANQHPTQTLLDLFSIQECQGTLENRHITFVGDLKYGRTVHSLVQALSLFGAQFTFIAPDALAMPDYLLDELKEKGCQFQCVTHIEEVVHDTDIIYMTRLQKERFDETEFKKIASRYILNNKVLREAPDHLKVLHPLPRVDEIAVEVDKTPYAYYFEQAKNGVYAREALLALILNEAL